MPEGRVLPALRAGPHRDADRRQPAGREGRRRGRNDRRDAGGRERGGRRAGAARRHAHRHAADARDASGGRCRSRPQRPRRRADVHDATSPVHLPPARQRWTRPSRCSRRRRRPAACRRPQPAAGDEAAARARRRAGRPGRIPGLDGIEQGRRRLCGSARWRPTSSVAGSDIVRETVSRYWPRRPALIGDRQVRRARHDRRQPGARRSRPPTTRPC